MIEIKNVKIVKFLEEKDSLVKEGRAISEKIDTVQKKIQENNKKQLEITAKVEAKELVAEGEALQKQINADLEKLNEIGNKIMKAKLDGIPDKVKVEFFALKEEQEKLEKDRNKIALKVQKIKDRVIPLIHKEVKDKLGEFDDIESTHLSKGKVIVKTYNKVEELKATLKKKK